MKFRVICDQTGRLRVRFGKYRLCPAVGYGISEQLMGVEGVLRVETNHVNGSVLVLYDGAAARHSVLQQLSALQRSTLPEALPSEEQKAREIELDFQHKLIWHCAKRLASVLLMPPALRMAFTWLRAGRFLRGGLRCLLRRKLGVEVLDATAIAAALLYGNYGTAGSTMFLLGLSDLLLDYSNARARHALAQSLAIRVNTVWLVQDGVECEIPLQALAVGDVIRVRQGSLIPVDGSIVRGDATINEATMTGEPLAVHKTVDGTVYAGTALEDGELDVAVRKLPDDSRIAHIIELIDTGEHKKALLQGKAERIADGIVPVSFGLFFATLALTRNVTRALSVLMVDFSCAIKLTTPISIISALKECVNAEVLVKGGKYLETLAKVDTVVFDKTGTLTNAAPAVSRVIPCHADYTEDEVLRIAACLEEHFPHSVAASIVAEAKTRDLVHPEDHGKVDYVVAHGIASSYHGQRAIIGSRHFVFEDEAVPFPVEQEQALQAVIGFDSAVYLAVNGTLVGVICISDPPRHDAKATIDLLRAEGIGEIIMITGDSEGSARYTSEILGLDAYFAAVLPDGKANLITELKAQGKTILMVGDGINDAPALSCADVSLTLNGSSDLAREVADISVLSDELEKIVQIRRLSQKLLAKIHRQYSFVVVFNTLLILCGLGGVLTASQSAWLHNASTIALAALSARPVLTHETAENSEVNCDETA